MKKAIFGVCGVYCEICPVYSREENRCLGCEYYNKIMEKKGKEKCPLYVCAKNRGIVSCFKCPDFPCELHYKSGIYKREALDFWKKSIAEGLI